MLESPIAHVAQYRAYGPGGDKLGGKEFLIATTTGGSVNEFRAGGRNWHTISEYLRPIQRAINRCDGTFLPAFVSYSPTAEAIHGEAARYAKHVRQPLEKLAQ